MCFVEFTPNLALYSSVFLGVTTRDLVAIMVIEGHDADQGSIPIVLVMSSSLAVAAPVQEVVKGQSPAVQPGSLWVSASDHAGSHERLPLVCHSPLSDLRTIARDLEGQTT